jgi:hypothetical protein
MAGLAPVGVKQTRVSRASRSAMPVKASLGSNFTAGGRVDFNGQKLSLGVAPGSRKGGSRCVTSMAAKVAGYIKLAIEAGKANPAPPIGPALGSKVRLPTRTRARAGKTRCGRVATVPKCVASRVTRRTRRPYAPSVKTRRRAADALARAHVTRADSQTRARAPSRRRARSHAPPEP